MIVMLSTASAGAQDAAVDEVLTKMSAKLATVKDLRATFAVTKYDALEEDTDHLRVEFWHKKPHLTKVDVYKKVKGVEQHTQQVILGKDTITRVWPRTRTGEKRKVDPKEMERRRKDRNDPLTFLSRNPDDLKKDFNVRMLKAPNATVSKIEITPKRKDVPFDYKAVELTVSRATWLPVAIRSVAKPITADDEPDWSLYEVKLLLTNIGLVKAHFLPLAGIEIKEVKAGEDAKKK